MEEQDYILFDQYLLGELSTEAQNTFNERLQKDSEFNKSFNTYKELSSFLENKFDNEAETVVFKENLKNISKKHFNVTKTIAEVPKKSKTFRIGQLAIAASVAIFLSIFAFNQFSNPTYSDYNDHEPMTIVRDANVKELIEATKAFNTKDYKKANVLLEEILKKDSDNRELQLYYAITNLELNNYDVTDVYLNELINGTSAYKNKALWYLALSQLKQKKIASCIVLLKQVPENTDDYKAAQKLLSKLD